MSTPTDTTGDIRNVIVVGSGPAGYTAIVGTRPKTALERELAHHLV
ncbi:hypothetical protein [Streptomyces sp. SID12488]|nr:hypothetical protein [Streptomyces sp. SID12488]NEA68480.1 hypothetical protein [Streptomyces sp. SID12488]